MSPVNVATGTKGGFKPCLMHWTPPSCLSSWEGIRRSTPFCLLLEASSSSIIFLSRITEKRLWGLKSCICQCVQGMLLLCGKCAALHICEKIVFSPPQGDQA